MTFSQSQMVTDGTLNLDCYNSQGSAAMHLRCGGSFNKILTDFMLNWSVKMVKI